MSAPVTLEFDNKVAIITLNRPEVLKAINEAMLPPWVDALEECRINTDVAVIVVTGAGEAFCRGGDTANLGANTLPSPLEIKEQFWSAEPITAEEALRIGMVNQVFEDDEFMVRSMES